MLFSPFHFLPPINSNSSFPLTLHVVFLHILAECVYKGKSGRSLVTQECMDSWENSYYAWRSKIIAWLFVTMEEYEKKMLSRIKSTSLFVCICSDFMEHYWLMPVKLLSAIYAKRKSEFWMIRGRVSNSFIVLFFFK